MLALAGICHNAFADAPKLGPFERPHPTELEIPDGTETFDALQALNGSYAFREACDAARHLLWIELDGEGDCIRYYPQGLAEGANPSALVYFGGDVMLRNAKGVRFITPTYSRQSPASIAADTAEWSRRAGIPAIVIARPGILGSSGDHNDRRRLREMRLMDRALDEIKARHSIGSFILAGHSAGGQIAASLLNWRKDIAAVAISSGMVSVKQVADFWENRRAIAGSVLYDVTTFYDPIKEIDRIARSPSPIIYVLSDPEDQIIPFYSQLHYVRRLRRAGFEPHHIYLHAKDRSHHVLAEYARLAVELVAKGQGAKEIRRSLYEMNVQQLE